MKTIQNLNDLREMLVAGTGKFYAGWSADAVAAIDNGAAYWLSKGKHVVVRHSDAVVELTDDEIAKAMGWSCLDQLDALTYDGIATSVLIKDIRAVIAADRAKQVSP